MTITYNNASFPTQQIIYPLSATASLIGKPLAGARVRTKSSIDNTTLKATYQTNVGDPPPANSNPVTANALGQVLIYWALNSDDPNDLYFVEILGPLGDDTVYYSYDNFSGASLIGGNPSGTAISRNYIRNPQFTSSRFMNPVSFINELGPVYVVDDWLFEKSNNSATDTFEFVNFSSGQVDVPNTPVGYLSWTVEATGAGETFKNLYQSCESVQTFNGETLSFQFYARSSTSSTLTISYKQFFGTGGSPSASVIEEVATIDLTPTWDLYSVTFTVDSTSGKTLGTAGNDSFNMQFSLPLNASSSTNIDFVNVQNELGAQPTAYQYTTVNEQKLNLDKQWFHNPVGDIIFKPLNASVPTGWIALDDGTIGSYDSIANNYNGSECFTLYSLFYDNYSNSVCPVSGGRGASASADFLANKTLTLPLSMGRLLGNAGAGSGLTSRAIGVTGGAETSNALLSHTHGLGTNVLTTPGTVGVTTITPSGSDVVPTSTVGSFGSINTTSSAGSGSSFSLMNPFAFVAKLFVKL